MERSGELHRQKIEFSDIIESGKELNQRICTPALWELKLRDYEEAQANDSLEIENERPRFTT